MNETQTPIPHPNMVRLARELGLSYERVWQAPYDFLLAVEAWMERQEREKQEAWDDGYGKCHEEMVMSVLHVEIPNTPTYDMTPNGRAGWRVKAKITKQAKSDAHYATIDALRAHDGLDLDCALAAATEIKVMILIRWEPRRKIMDDDNALSGCKSLLDGVASAIGRDDKVFRILSIKQERDPDGRGHVAVTLIPVGRNQEATAA